MYSKLCKRFASKVTEQLKIWDLRKSENEKKISKPGGDTS